MLNRHIFIFNAVVFIVLPAIYLAETQKLWSSRYEWTYCLESASLRYLIKEPITRNISFFHNNVRLVFIFFLASVQALDACEVNILLLLLSES